MNALLDIIIIAIAALTIYFSVKNGFIKTLLSASSFLIAIIITVALLAPVKNAFMETSGADALRERVRISIEDILTSNNVENSEEVDTFLASGSSNQELYNILDKVGLEREELQQKVSEWKKETGADLKQKLIAYISDPIVDALVTVCVICLLFFGSLIILKIATYILDKVCRLPVLKTANKLLGVILGVVLAFVRIYLFCLLIKILLPYGEALDISALTAIHPESTLLFKWFYNFNIFNFLLS